MLGIDALIDKGLRQYSPLATINFKAHSELMP